MRWSSPRIAQHDQIPRSTVTAERRRQGLNRLAALEPPRLIRRDERPRPGELVHLDIKRLGTYSEVLPDELGDPTAAFLVRAVAWFAAHGIVVERLLTDNGGAYRSLTFASTCLDLGISQRFTRAYRPKSMARRNG